jgi:predicted ATPase
MPFDHVLAQVLELLVRQGWASYQTLRRRFSLDEAALAALTQHLLETQPVTIDNTGTRLMWQGELRPASGPTRLIEVVTTAPSVAGAAPQPREGERRRGLTPLVGRAQEVELLLARWAQVQAGQGQVVGLHGEAGIGKSRLVQVVSTHVAGTPYRQWACRGVPTLRYSAFAPVLDLLQQVLEYQPEDSPAVKLQQLETLLASCPGALPDAVPLLATLLAVPLDERYAPLTLTPERQRQHTLETVLTVLRGLAAHQPVLLIVEDLHWVDPSTLELLGLLVAQAATARLYVLLTWRPEFQPPWPPAAHQTTLTLGRLLPAQVEQLATQVAGGKGLPSAVLEQLVARTEGVPLFVEELTQMVLASGLVREEGGHYALPAPLPPLALPPTVQAALGARLAQLGEAQAVAQVGAVWGRGFTEAQLQAVAPVAWWQLDQALTRLVEADILRELPLPPRLTYVFKHALLQEAAYASLPLARRQQVHGQVAQVLAERFPETVATQPELLAQHYTAAGLSTQALSYWQRAGQQALQRSANLEAIAHLTRGLEVLHTLPDSLERTWQELAVQTTLGPALMVVKGFGAQEVEHTYRRAHALSRQIGAGSELVPVLAGLWAFYLVRAELQTAREVGHELLTLAERTSDLIGRLLAHQVLGCTLYQLGELGPAQAHLMHAIRIYDPPQHHSLAMQYGHDPGVISYANAGLALQLLGYPDQAWQRSHEGLGLAQELAHPFTLAHVFFYFVNFHYMRRESQRVQERAEMLITLAREGEFAMGLAWGTLLRGWALAVQGRGEEGMAQIRQGLTAVQATGARLGEPLYLLILAEALGQAGHLGEGLEALAKALEVAHHSGERYLEAELYRLKGEFLGMQSTDNMREAEACLHQALTIARHQQAKSWELRAAMSLARLWQQQGKRAEAHAMLAPIYGWFTEGFGTADLLEARALLDELA